jgi:hypothetical protein
MIFKLVSTTAHRVVLLAILVVILIGCQRPALNTSTVVKPNLSVPIRVSSPDVDSAEPAIAASPDGSIYATWVNHTPNGQADVMLAHFDANGQMQGAPVRVNQKPGTATAWRGDPPTIVVGSDRTVLIGWTARANLGSGHATDLYLSASKDGKTFGEAVKVNDDAKPGVHGMHSLAVGNNGRIFMAWLDERNITPMAMKDKKTDKSSGRHMESNRELFVASSIDGGRTFSANRRIATEACPCCKTSLAIGPDGRLYVSWRQVLAGDFRHIAVATSTDAAQTFSQPVIVSDDQWMLSGCPVSGASLLAAADGRLKVLWYAAGEKGENGIYWSESRDGGHTFSARQIVAATDAVGTPVLVKSVNGKDMAVWESNQKESVSLRAAQLPVGSKGDVHQFVLGDGELPAAAVASGKLFTLYLKKQDNKQYVWLITAPAAAP